MGALTRGTWAACGTESCESPAMVMPEARRLPALTMFGNVAGKAYAEPPLVCESCGYQLELVVGDALVSARGAVSG